MKVKDLISKLEKCDPEMEVFLYYSLGCGSTPIDVLFQHRYNERTELGVISKKNFESFSKYAKEMKNID